RAGVPRGLRINRDAARARGMEGALRLGGRRCDERREQRRSLMRAARAFGGPLRAPPQRATVGDFVGLCLLIDFSDAPATIARTEVDNFCNRQGYSGFGNNGSVFDYFLENSIGRCRYTNVVTQYYRAQHPKSFYTDPSIEFGTRARQLIVEALNHLKANNFDFSTLTADNGGFVYATNVFYAGDVVNNWSEGLWPHAWHLANPVQLVPGKSAFDYQFTAIGNELSLGTFCHENGHMLCDYPDLYDYGYESSGVGAYCLMCAGGNVSEKNPTHINAYLKRLSGWARNVKVIEHGQQIELPAGQNDFAIHAKNAGEYFLLENRRRHGRDAALPDEGLAIWHIDEEGSNNNEQMTPALHYELSLVQADGRFDLERKRGHNGDTSDLFGDGVVRFADATAPNSKWWDGSASNLDVFEIAAPGPTVLFRARLFDDGGGAAQTITGMSSPNLAIPDSNAAGIADTITIAEDGLIAGVKVAVDITHTYRGDLRVTLQTPWGGEIRLHERHQGGSADHIQQTYDESAVQALATLHGRSTQGTWRLLVQDLAPLDTGKLNRWALEFTAPGQAAGQVVLEEAPGLQIPDASVAGITRALGTSAPGQVASVEIEIDITHTFIGDLRVALRSPAGTEVLLHNQTGSGADDIVKTYTAATTPALANLAGQAIKGTWSLNVSDRLRQDVGKLNRWRAVIKPA
ncbi:MAG TPA: M6 family metalloprotease domain-containing protein, partial [Burkholderiaceae bacterium]|nr:M6 family metalloprotease domain-containing protein [Burkholderiaceae bacterium]